MHLLITGRTSRWISAAYNQTASMYSQGSDTTKCYVSVSAIKANSFNGSFLRLVSVGKCYCRKLPVLKFMRSYIIVKIDDGNNITVHSIFHFVTGTVDSLFLSLLLKAFKSTYSKIGHDKYTNSEYDLHLSSSLSVYRLFNVEHQHYDVIIDCLNKISA